MIFFGIILSERSLRGIVMIAEIITNQSGLERLQSMNRVLELFTYFSSLEPQSSEHNICKAVVENLDQISSISSAQMATQAFTSEPTIRRFCKNLGYSSFADLKKVLNVDYNEIKTIASVILRMNNSTSDSIIDLYDKSIKTLGKVQEMFNEERLGRLKDLAAICNKLRIYSVTPFSYTPLLIAILHSRGIDASAPLFTQYQQEELTSLDNKSLVVMIGDPKTFYDAYSAQIEIAYKKGVKFCLCLNEEISIMTKYASVDFSFDTYKPCGYIAADFMLGAIMRAYTYTLVTET